MGLGGGKKKKKSLFFFSCQKEKKKKYAKISFYLKALCVKKVYFILLQNPQHHEHY